MSIIATLPVFLLSNPTALKMLLEKDEYEHVFNDDAAAAFWQGWAGVASWQRDSLRPGHVFTQRWEKYRTKRGTRLMPALDCVGEEYLQVVNRRLYVKSLEQFSRWQNLRGRMSMLPIKCRMLYRNRLPMSGRLVHPLVPELADYISREGLNETHLHLFACQEAEFSWLQDLADLTRFETEEIKDWAKNKPLYQGVHPELTTERLVSHMKLARYLRNTLLFIMEGASPDPLVEQMRREYHAYVHYADGYAPPETPCLYDGDTQAMLEQEVKMWQALFAWVDECKDYYRDLEFYAHLYLLIQNEYTDLRRQREERCGFDAFDAVEKHKGQGVTEQKYIERTLSHLLRNTEARAGNVLELRVSPWVFCYWGAQIADICKELCKKSGRTMPQLVLAVHFIKMKAQTASASDDMLLADRYASWRLEYAARCQEVAAYAPYLMRDKGVRVGIDAAGDEMLMPAEVFAPVFRQFERACGIGYKTYHCGEDFIHLIGGIRAVYDAVKFLDLRQGNRVGHATAIGIPPKTWKRDMPDVLVLRKGDLLLDLLFAWRILAPCRLEAAVKVERRLMPLAQTLLDGPLNMHLLQDFYDARGLFPECVRDYLDRGTTVEWSDNPEMQCVIDFARERGAAALYLVHAWHYCAASRKMQEEHEEIELDFLDDDILLLLQQKVQHLLNKRNVVIETLPVSNLRISQYRDIQDHHLLRWLCVKDCGVEGDEKMTVCMGSDDPGIFVSDLKNEFYHVFANLRLAGLPPAECMEHIRQLNDAGRIYAFRQAIPEDELDVCGWPGYTTRRQG